ncbi:MAG: hypothetical protein MUF14_11050 [Hyphomonadaceae bacterium]|jgi:hypothetical protein|nr:hypothetical protein [Hyphomonadaceae bacterium]
MSHETDIDAAIIAEEKALLAAIGEEPGFIRQATGLFAGPAGWVGVVLMVSQTGLFVAGAWAGWHFFQAADTLEALQWGLPAAVALLMALMIKLSLVPQMQANRVIREIRRLEVILARAGDME